MQIEVGPSSHPAGPSQPKPFTTRTRPEAGTVPQGHTFQRSIEITSTMVYVVYGGIFEGIKYSPQNWLLFAPLIGPRNRSEGYNFYQSEEGSKVMLGFLVP